MERSLALAVSLIVAAFLAWLYELPPRPLHADAPPAAFSAERAMADVSVIASRPHPIGSPANAAVRDHLLGRLGELGLSPRVQATTAFEERDGRYGRWLLGGRVENIVGVLPGRDRAAPALAIMAHYDSVPGSPGAADDAAGAAAALEIVRALKTHGTPARDVVVLLTDGEEAGLLGARAFFDEDPLARRIGFLVNMEARGGGGRVQMFQTGPANGEAIALFRKATHRPESSSLAVFLYEQMPNDTDFTVSKAAGVDGLNFAFIGRQFDYHSPSSTPRNLDRRTLQDLGAQVLAVSEPLAFDARLPARSPSLVYAQTPTGVVLAYPPASGWAVLALAAALLALGVWRARKTDAFRWLDVAQGVGVSVYLLATAAVLLRLARRATGAGFGFMEHRFLEAQATRFEIALALVAVGAVLYAASALARGKVRAPAAALALGAGVICSAFGDIDPIGLGIGLAGAVTAFLVFGRAAGTAGAWAGLLATGLAAAAALQALAPATAFLLAWPLALACLGAALSGLGAIRNLWITLAFVALAIPGLAWLGTFGHGLYLGLDMPELLALTAWLAAFLIWPMAHPRMGGAGRITAALVLAAGFLLVADVRLHTPWSERFPQASLVAYRLDAESGRASRVSATPDLPEWSRRVLTADGGTIATTDIPALWPFPVKAAPAPAIAAPAARVALTRRADGAVELHAQPPQGARTLALQIRADAAVTDVTVNGRPAGLLTAPGRWSKLRWSGDPSGVTIAFRPRGAGAVEVRHAAVNDGWPQDAAPLPPRPDDVAAFDLSDSTIVTGTSRLRW